MARPPNGNPPKSPVPPNKPGNDPRGFSRADVLDDIDPKYIRKSTTTRYTNSMQKSTTTTGGGSTPQLDPPTSKTVGSHAVSAFTLAKQGINIATNASVAASRSAIALYRRMDGFMRRMSNQRPWGGGVTPGRGMTAFIGRPNPTIDRETAKSISKDMEAVTKYVTNSIWNTTKKVTSKRNTRSERENEKLIEDTIKKADKEISKSLSASIAKNTKKAAESAGKVLGGGAAFSGGELGLNALGEFGPSAAKGAGKLGLKGVGGLAKLGWRGAKASGRGLASLARSGASGVGSLFSGMMGSTAIGGAAESLGAAGAAGGLEAGAAGAAGIGLLPGILIAAAVASAGALIWNYVLPDSAKSAITDKISGFFGTIGDSLGGMLNGITSSFPDWIKSTLGGLGSLGAMAWDKVKSGYNFITGGSASAATPATTNSNGSVVPQNTPSVPMPAPPPPPQTVTPIAPTTQAGVIGPLADVKALIRKGESKNNPDALNGQDSRGKMIATTGTEAFGKPLTSMTIGEVYQRTLAAYGKAGGGTGAAGLYQFIPATLKTIMDRQSKTPGGLSWDDLFSVQNQDRLADSQIGARLKGKTTREGQIKALSQEWASLPMDSSGRGYYDGKQHNKALINYADLNNAFDNTGAQVAALTKGATGTFAAASAGAGMGTTFLHTKDGADLKSMGPGVKNSLLWTQRWFKKPITLIGKQSMANGANISLKGMTDTEKASLLIDGLSAGFNAVYFNGDDSLRFDTRKQGPTGAIPTWASGVMANRSNLHDMRGTVDASNDNGIAASSVATAGNLALKGGGNATSTKLGIDGQNKYQDVGKPTPTSKQIAQNKSTGNSMAVSKASGTDNSMDKPGVDSIFTQLDDWTLLQLLTEGLTGQ